MSDTLSIRINPECLPFLNQAQAKKNISARQNTFIDSVNELHATVNQLKKQTDFQLDKKQEKEISRGVFYALTPSLEKKSATKQQAITLTDLQNVLNKEFYIKDKSATIFIIMSLLEPNSLPFALATLAYSVLTDDSIWSNECTALDSRFKYTLKAKSDPSKANIIFNMRMHLKNAQFPENSSLGSLSIQFTINQEKQIKLLPLNMEFNFVDKKAFKQFKKELCRDFRDWIFLHKPQWKIPDLWIIPMLIGYLLGLIVMISLLSLSLTPISPLLLPPLGLMLGLGLASCLHVFVHRNLQKDQEIRKRPIHLFNGKLFVNPHRSTTSFFVRPTWLNHSVVSEVSETHFRYH
ncbi:hypothetical protein [Rickettsiella endosymbiont of Litargus connexus]|jgi:hypothetical protein|uniref:hypothetical protein n=1 Tax=Rickettsiella endosymbiont of Litargus connexus TaxID=3066237 RepID=UPI0027FB5769|nr:hypothetical protein [Gammaproteobacteria bacterium]MCH9754429.1 hypothetical protein [Gammaproteobacteria bacterium]MDD4893456.1 hypothetical protein [Candidatus Rickettsiella isopodorum]MDD5161830.1 hypothetical protein [Candidatus Rickettsiella isopodorum]MDQ5900103.1 hypothetical protein [Pseudomonadota bacterium]